MASHPPDIDYVGLRTDVSGGLKWERSSWRGPSLAVSWSRRVDDRNRASDLGRPRRRPKPAA
jgi:hypothetical protein